MFDFEHHPLVGLVGEIDGLGEDSIETGTFESLEPVQREAAVFCCRRDVDGRFGGLQERFQLRAAFAEWRGAQVALSI